MDIKKVLIELAEAQADKVKDEMMSQLSSSDMEEKIASAINAKIDIPFVSEDKAQLIFEKVVDVGTDLLQGILKGK